MKLATPFQLYSEYEDVIDEWNINYDPYKYSKTDKLHQAAAQKNESEMLFDKLISFVEKYPNKRINIAIPDTDIPIRHFNTLNKIHDNIFIKLNLYQFNWAKKLKENNIKFFFDITVPITTFTLLDEVIKLGVTDIYVADDMCYNLDNVRAACDKHGIQIRLILNRIPATTFGANTDIRAPIFSPRHFEILDNYIDVAEFDCFYEKESDAYNWGLFKVLYKAWFINHDWWNDLREINYDLEIFYPVRQELPNFIKRKINCGRKCVYSKRCNKCEIVMEIANEFYEEGSYIKLNKGRNE